MEVEEESVLLYGTYLCGKIFGWRKKKPLYCTEDNYAGRYLYGCRRRSRDTVRNIIMQEDLCMDVEEEAVLLYGT